jgi:hypothetical protein
MVAIASSFAFPVTAVLTAAQGLVAVRLRSAALLGPERGERIGHHQ